MLANQNSAFKDFEGKKIENQLLQEVSWLKRLEIESFCHASSPFEQY